MPLGKEFREAVDGKDFGWLWTNLDEMGEA